MTQKSLDLKQQVQEAQYTYPYHYIPGLADGKFTQTQHWSWGFRYLGGIQVVLDQLQRVSFQSLVDIGCGDGRFLREVVQFYPRKRFLGVDYSQQAIQLARAMNPQLDYEVLNIIVNDLPQKFEVATLIEVLEHISPDMVPQFIQAIARSLEPAGCLILTVPHLNQPVSDKHYQHFTSATLLQLLTPFFEDVEFFPFDARSYGIIKLLQTLMGGDGRHFIVTNPKVVTWFYQLYRKHFLYTTDESKCRRIAAVCKKRIILLGESNCNRNYHHL